MLKAPFVCLAVFGFILGQSNAYAVRPYSTVTYDVQFRLDPRDPRIWGSPIRNSPVRRIVQVKALASAFRFNGAEADSSELILTRIGGRFTGTARLECNFVSGVDGGPGEPSCGPTVAVRFAVQLDTGPSVIIDEGWIPARSPDSPLDDQKTECVVQRSTTGAIEKCGGVFEKSIRGRESGKDVLKRRYWIELL